MPRWPTRTLLQPQRRPAQRSASAPRGRDSHTAPKMTAALRSDPSLRRRRVGAPSSKMASAKRARSPLCTVAPGESELVVQAQTRDMCGPRTSVCPVYSGSEICLFKCVTSFELPSQLYDKREANKDGCPVSTSSHSTEMKPKYPDTSADILVLFGFRVPAL